MRLVDITFRNCNENSAQNFNRVQIGHLTLWFSYETLVAFRTPQTGLVATENVWGTTTGKHLNWICRKEQRIPREEFLKLINSIKIDFSMGQ